jgi:hypothetical protein
MSIRCALYARVSTLNGQDPSLQTVELHEYAARRGWEVVGEFVDKGVSGSKDSRPQLDAMMKLAKARKVDLILVWKLDRFGRSLRHLVNALAELEALGIAFVSLRDNLDLSTPSGRLMFQIIGAMALEVRVALLPPREGPCTLSSHLSCPWTCQQSSPSLNPNRSNPRLNPLRPPYECSGLRRAHYCVSCLGVGRFRA